MGSHDASHLLSGKISTVVEKESVRQLSAHCQKEKKMF